MIRTLDYRQRTLFAAPVAAVWAVLSDPHQHVELHPLIHNLTVTDQGQGPGPGERFMDFEVVDQLQILGPLKLPIRYRTHMIIDAQRQQLRMRATCPPRLITDVRWTLRPTDDGGTELDEQVELSAPALIVAYSIQTSRRAHEAMFSALRQRLSPAP